MNKYYELHENFWQGLIEKGHISWDKESKEELLLRDRNQVLYKYIKDSDISTALDLGCGSGSQSFYLSSLGIECTGIDISPTAINKGRELAKEMNVSIDFKCDDVCSFDLGKKFDLVTDSCLLHCLVWEEDRKKLFSKMKSHLAGNGKAFIYTMIRDERVNPFDEQDYFYFDNDGILWSKGPESFDVNWKTINGESYFPHRRVYTLEEQRAEIVASDLKIIHEEVLIEDDIRNKVYAAWCE